MGYRGTIAEPRGKGRLNPPGTIEDRAGLEERVHLWQSVLEVLGGLAHGVGLGFPLGHHDGMVQKGRVDLLKHTQRCEDGSFVVFLKGKVNRDIQ